ncbi:MAG: Smr/MutS family protein [Candidatus Dojkabacteria bacterium]
MKKKAHLNKYSTKEEIVRFIPEAELDFHIVDKFDPYDIESMLNRFLEDCYLDKLENIIVIVGKGFVIRPFVQKLLKANKFVREFKQASFYNGQSGAFEVKLLTI